MDMIELEQMLSKKQKQKEDAEIVSLCRYRENKQYLAHRTKRIKMLEELREEMKMAEYYLFNFVSAMDGEEDEPSKEERITTEHVRFMYEQWHSVRNIVERKIKKTKGDE